MKALFFFFVMSSPFLFSQQVQVEDYKTLIIPQKFDDSKMNNYHLATLLAKGLKAKRYEVLSGNTETLPQEVRNNPCNSLTANLKDASNMLRNRLDLYFTDCMGKTVFTIRGVSILKEFEEGLQDALQQALLKVPYSAPKFSVAQTLTQGSGPETTQPIEELPKVQKANTETEAVNPTKSSSPNQLFSNGKMALQKINIGNGKFILVAPGSDTPYATFSKSFKENIFHVSLQNGDMTLGYFENESYIIEIPDGSGFKKEIFKAEAQKNVK